MLAMWLTLLKVRVLPYKMADSANLSGVPNDGKRNLPFAQSFVNWYRNLAVSRTLI